VGELDGSFPGEAGRAAAALRGWDGAMAARGPAALFALVERALQRETFEDEAERAELPRIGSRWRLQRLLGGEISADWWDDVRTSAREGRAEIVERALAAAWRQGVERWGEEVASWPYAEIHVLELEHPLGSLPILGRWFVRGPFPLPGSSTTVDALGGPWKDDRIAIAYGPSMRFVTDARNPADSFAILPGGQAGHPADPHYDDQLPLYLAGDARPVPWGRAAQDRAAVTRLTLVP
jgi:penicillin amidase